MQALDKRLKQRIERSMVDGELEEGAVAHREHPTGPHGIMAKRVQHRKVTHSLPAVPAVPAVCTDAVCSAGSMCT